MIRQNFLKLSSVACVLLLGGCASWFFPDFEEDQEVAIDAGGNVEVREIQNKGVLVADKENALYEGEEESEIKKESDEDKITEAKVEPIDVTPLVDNEVKKGTDDNNKAADEAVSDSVSKPSMRYLAGVIYFNNGAAGIDGEERAKLKKIAQTAKQNNAMVEVLGFASSRTRNTDPVTHKLANFNISAKRAESTAAALRGLGVKADRIDVQALSDSMPMYQEVMPEGERLNRRAEIYLTY